MMGRQDRDQGQLFYEFRLHEMIPADHLLRRINGFASERMRLRGLTGARDEFHLAAIVQNLKTMALRLLGPPTRGACPAIA